MPPGPLAERTLFLTLHCISVNLHIEAIWFLLSSLFASVDVNWIVCMLFKHLVINKMTTTTITHLLTLIIINGRSSRVLTVDILRRYAAIFMI